MAIAFANAELINALDWDATLAPGHVTPFVLPAYLALGETLDVSGKDLILANVIAHELSHRLGKALRNQRQVREDKIEFPPIMGYSCSVLGGALGVGKIKGYGRDLLAACVGTAAHIAPARS